MLDVCGTSVYSKLVIYLIFEQRGKMKIKSVCMRALTCYECRWEPPLRCLRNYPMMAYVLEDCFRKSYNVLFALVGRLLSRVIDVSLCPL
jgi:hypothetical protein